MINFPSIFLDIIQVTKKGRQLIDFPCGELAELLSLTFDQLKYNCEYQFLSLRYRLDKTKSLRELANDVRVSEIFRGRLNVVINKERLMELTFPESALQVSKKRKREEQKERTLSSLLEECNATPQERSSAMIPTYQTFTLGLNAKYYLHWILASSLGHEKKRKLLEIFKEDPYVFKFFDARHRMPLSLVAAFCETSFLKELFERGIYASEDCKYVDINDESPLEYAIKGKNIGNIYFILENRPDLINRFIRDEITVFQFAIKHQCFDNQNDFDQFFESEGTDLSDSHGATLLHYAAQYYPECIMWLMEAQYSSESDFWGNLPIHTAAMHWTKGHYADYSRLFDTQNHTGFLARNNAGENLFHLFFKKNTSDYREEIFEELVELGRSLDLSLDRIRLMLNEKDNTGLSPLAYLLLDTSQEMRNKINKIFPYQHFFDTIDSTMLACTKCEDHLSHPFTIPEGRTLCGVHLFDSASYGEEDSFRFSPSTQLQTLMRLYNFTNRTIDRAAESKLLALFEYADTRELIFKTTSEQKMEDIIEFGDKKLFYYLDDPNFTMSLIFPLRAKTDEGEIKIELSRTGIIKLLQLCQPGGKLEGGAWGWNPRINRLFLLFPLKKEISSLQGEKCLADLRSFSDSINKFLHHFATEEFNNTPQDRIDLELSHSLQFSTYGEETQIDETSTLTRWDLLSYLDLTQVWTPLFVDNRGNLVSKAWKE